jgi:hypothetical protein
MLGGIFSPLADRPFDPARGRGAIRIIIDRIFNPRAMPRAIQRFAITANGLDIRGDPLGEAPVPDLPPGRPWKTRLDTDLSNLLKEDGDFALIRIDLPQIEARKANLVFLGADEAITAQDQAGAEMFFNLRVSNDRQIARFHCFYSAGNGFGAFNIGFLVREANQGPGGFGLPIIIDPTIRNRHD